MAPPRRIPPPPTRYAIATGQPSLGPPRPAWQRPAAPAPPPTAFARYPAAWLPRAVPPPRPRAVQRMEAPPATASGSSGARERSNSAPPALGSGNLKQSRRIVIKCTMGQGLVGHLGRVVLMSDRFSSCSPVILFNARTGMGGLFHFAAQNWKEQPDSLEVMYQAIKPTVIYLCDRTTATDLMYGLPKSTDHILQEEFFRDACGHTGEIKMMTLKSDVYYVTLGADGKIRIFSDSIGAMLDVSSGEWVQQVEDWPLSDATTSYAMEGAAKTGRNLW